MPDRADLDSHEGVCYPQHILTRITWNVAVTRARRKARCCLTEHARCSTSSERSTLQAQCLCAQAAYKIAGHDSRTQFFRPICPGKILKTFKRKIFDYSPLLFLPCKRGGWTPREVGLLLLLLLVVVVEGLYLLLNGKQDAVRRFLIFPRRTFENSRNEN